MTIESYFSIEVGQQLNSDNSFSCIIIGSNFDSNIYGSQIFHSQDILNKKFCDISPDSLHCDPSIILTEKFTTLSIS